MKKQPDYSRLPKSWGVLAERGKTDLMKRKVSPALREHRNWDYNTYGEYYGVKRYETNSVLGGKNCFDNIYTIEEFIALTEPEEEFVLPEEWYIDSNSRKEDDIIVDYMTSVLKYNTCRGYRTGGWRYYSDSDETNYADEVEERKGHTKLSFEQFQRYVLKQEPTKTEQTMSTQPTVKDTDLVVIPQELLQEGYNAGEMNTARTNFIKEKMNIFTREMKILDVREFYKNNVNENCKWRLKLEVAFPFLKEPEEIVIKYGKLLDGKELYDGFNGLIIPRTLGTLKEKGFFLHENYKWEIQKDNQGASCLVPTRK